MINSQGQFLLSTDGGAPTQFVSDSLKDLTFTAICGSSDKFMLLAAGSEIFDVYKDGSVAVPPIPQQGTIIDIYCRGSTFVARTTTGVYWIGSLAGQTADEWTDLATMAMSEGDKALYKPEKIVKINV